MHMDVMGMLWELATRCSAQLGAVPEYRLPFEKEIEQHPSFEDIAECVVNKRLKLAFKDNWKKSHSGSRGLCQTIEECWTHCAEDRISARCVFERCSRWQYRRNKVQWSFCPSIYQ